MAVPYDADAVRAYHLFRIGNNTAQIARLMEVSEPAVVKMLDYQRTRSRKLPRVKYERAPRKQIDVRQAS